MGSIILFMPILNCPCGNKKEIPAYKIPRKKYCSKKCFYKFRIRPKGLYYNIVTVNKSWFKKGFISWNKGKTPSKESRRKMSVSKKGKHCSVKTEFKKGDKHISGYNNFNWKGTKVGYSALHRRIKRLLGKPTKCSHCNGTKKIQWANKSHKYLTNINDWISLCYWCHRKYDKKYWGSIKRRWPTK